MIAPLALLTLCVGSALALDVRQCKTNAECFRAGLPPLKPRFKGQARAHTARQATPLCTAAPAMFTYTGAITSCMIDQMGSYQISAAGAQGNSVAHGGGSGGYGTLAVGDGFIFNAGQIIQLAVGGQGSTTPTSEGGGGGGGSFVYIQPANSAPTVLVVGGGGGGGAAGPGGVANGNNAPLTPDSDYTAGSGNQPGVAGTGAGGKDGDGGQAGVSGEFGVQQGNGGGGGAGGGGVWTNGSTAVALPGNSAGGPARGGIDLLSGLAGGAGSEGATNQGGFGGGGGGGFESGGGGGGYSGGGGGGIIHTPIQPYPGGGGGGSSYVATNYSSITTSFTAIYSQYTTGDDNGYISITVG